MRFVSSDEYKIDEILKSFNLKQVSNKKAIKCSTGEQVRCSIATAILKNTRVLLLDEPTANLDKSNKKMVFEILSEYAKNHLVIVSTHDIDYIEDDYNTYRIEDTKLICEKQVESTSQEYTNTNTKNIKNDFLISLKLGFKNAFKHKVTFAFSFIFLCLFLISIFAVISFGLLNERRTKVAAVNSAISGETSYFTLNDISLDNLNSITEPHFYSTYGLCGYEETDDSGDIVTKYTSFNIACLEDLNEETQKIYKPYFDNYTYDDANTFPLVTNEDYLKQFLNNISDSYNPIPSIASLKVGDTFKITFKSCSASSKTYHVTSNQSQDFTITGIISSEEQKKVHEFYETSSTLTEDFPCIIRRKIIFLI